MTEIADEVFWQPTCPADNGCIVTNPLDPECGSDPYHLAPLELAEAICPYALDGLRHSIEQRRKSLGNHLTLGWIALEQGMATDDDTYAEAYFADADNSFRKAVEKGSQKNLPFAMRAWHAMHYINAFRERRATGTLSKKTIDERYTELGEELHTVTLADNLSSTRDTGEVSGLVSEFVIAGLLMRTRQANLFPYPASSREEHAIIPTEEPLSSNDHHDYYILDPDKIPLQIKRQRNLYDDTDNKYDASVTVIHARHIMDNIKQATYPSRLDHSVMSHRLASYMTAEARGQVLDKRSSRILRTGSSVVANLVQKLVNP